MKVGKKIIKQNKKMIDQMDSEMCKQMRLDVDEEIACGSIEKKDAPDAKILRSITREQFKAVWGDLAKWKKYESWNHSNIQELWNVISGWHIVILLLSV